MVPAGGRQPPPNRTPPRHPSPGPIPIHTYVRTYIHTDRLTYIHTCLYLPTYVGTYILHPTHPTGGGGEAEVPCMIVGFQGGSTPNPRNHPHRMHTYIHTTYIHTYVPYHTITLRYVTLRYVTLRYITLHYIRAYKHAYMHTCIHAYIHTYMPIPTNLRRYIHTTPNPPHRAGRGSIYVPCMIVGFQGGNTPNPRNHPHRIHTYIHACMHTYIHTLHYIALHCITLHYIHTCIHTYMPIPTNLRRYIHTTPNPPHRGGRGSRGTLHDSWIPGR